MSSRRSKILWSHLAAFTVAGCVSTSSQLTSPMPTSYTKLQPYLLARSASVEIFRAPGPFDVEEVKDFKIRVSPDEVINSDLYFSRQKDKAPLLIFQHGNLSNKTVHSDQARRAATWGMHAIVLEQPNENQWMKNGKTLSKLVNLLFMWPAMLDERFDHNNMILVGHSFGGSAVSIAAGMSAPVKGLILLDPALVSSRVKKYLPQVKVPAMILGADKRVFHSRKRATFFKMFADATELSIKDATHNDAQFPNEFSLAEWIGIESEPSEDKQELFAASIVASALSLAAGGDNRYFLKAIKPEMERGNIIKVKKK